MRINQNIAALNSYRHLSITDNRLNRSLERLSSGLRINRAADDAAGLAISEKMRGQISGLRMASRNAQDGISLMQTAEGAINEIHSMLQRMRELAVQAANETYTSSDRMEIQKEIEQLKMEIDRVSNATEFNTKKLLDGSSSAITSTDSTTTHVYMRDGLRKTDDFGQKIEGGGNFKIDVQAEEIGQAQVQKSNIFMVKHGEEKETVTNDSPGYAKAAFTAVSTVEVSSSGTFNFVIGGEHFQFELEANTLTANTTTALARYLNNELGHIISAYGDGDAVSWRNTQLGGNDLVIVLDGRDYEGRSFDFWVEDANNLATLPDTAQTYDPGQEFVEEVSVSEAGNLFVGDYQMDMTLVASGTGTAQNTIIDQYIQSDASDIVTTASLVSAQNTNISLMLEVTDIDDGGSITVRYDYHVLNDEGKYVSESGGTRTLVSGSNTVSFGDVSFDDLELAAASDITVGDRVVINGYQHSDADNTQKITLRRDGSDVLEYTFKEDHFDSDNTSQEIRFYQLDRETGSYKNSSFDISFNSNAWSANGSLLQFEDATGQDLTVENAALFTIEMSEGIGHLASEDTRLSDIREFWDSNGRFLLENPRTITIVQGDGKQTFFTIDRNDTLGTLREKINKAISDQKPQYLGQSRYTDGDIENLFAEYIDEPGDGHRSVEGTMIVRSVIPGRQGELSLFGNADIINALGFQTVQQSTETVFDISVTDAHTGEIVDENVRISSNLMVGVVHPNVDVEFDPLAGMTKVSELDDWGSFNLVRDEDPLTTFIHLKDSTMIFQIGPNPGQDVGAAIGRMDSRALGVNGILVTDRLKANDAIDFIDRAMDLVSGERSKLGAVQNRLEHTVNSLSVAIENLTASESRIRDLDIAEEMVSFTKDQILMQAGTAMLAQANMKPQAIMQLLG